MNSKIVIAAGLLLLPQTPSFAQSIPKYDVEKHCNEVAGFGGTYSQMIFNGCIQQEQSAYDDLKVEWSAIPDQIQRHCDEVASFGGAGTYMILQGCIAQEMQAGSNREGFKF